MNTATKLGKIIVGMNRALGEIPLTVKLRTGIKDGNNNAHRLMPKLASEWGAGALTVHEFPLIDIQILTTANSVTWKN
jgi:tRNA-dihydrouridine synthase 3